MIGSIKLLVLSKSAVSVSLSPMHSSVPFLGEMEVLLTCLDVETHDAWVLLQLGDALLTIDKRATNTTKATLDVERAVLVII